MNRRLHAWLHRKGIARVLGGGSNSLNDHGTAFVEARGPRWLALRLARYAMRHSVICSPDWRTVRVTGIRQPGRLHYRILFAFRRA